MKNSITLIQAGMTQKKVATELHVSLRSIEWCWSTDKLGRGVYPITIFVLNNIKLWVNKIVQNKIFLYYQSSNDHYIQ